MILLDSKHLPRRRSRPHFHHEVLTNRLPAGRVRIQLDDERGVRFDITDLVDLDSLSSIDESLEEDLTQFVHGDLDIPIRDPDGAVEQYFLRDPLAAGITVRILREKLFHGRRVWETVFGGVLDQPWSVEIDRKNRIVSAQFFSYSKLLEQTSAEGVGRQLTDVTGTVSASSDQVTLSDASEALVGDILVLTDSYATEEHEIESIVANVVTTTETWDTTFTDAPATLKKAFYRNKGIAFLAGELFREAGIEAYNIQLRDLGEDLLVSPGNWYGLQELGTTDFVRAWTVKDGIYRADQGLKGKTTPDAATEWSDVPGGVNVESLADWTPYQDTEPATFLDALDASKAADIFEIGSTRAEAAGQNGASRPCWDYLNGHIWEWDISSGNTRLWKDGVQEGGNIETSVGNSAVFIEHFPATDEVWYSRARNGGTLSTRVYDVSGASWTEISTTRAGKLRTLARIGLVAMHEHTDNITPTTTISFWDPTTQTVVHELTIPTPEAYVWTMRTDGEKIAMIYQTAGAVRLIVWAYPSWEVLAEYPLGATGDGDYGATGFIEARPFLTRMDVADGESHFMGVSGNTGTQFIVAPYYAGIVPLADFDGSSCAAALKDLAVLTLCQFGVRPEKVGYYRNRVFRAPEDAGAEISVDRPLSISEMPVWEGYRTRVEVAYRDVDANEGILVGGASGDSARTMEVDSPLVQTPAHAEWLAERLAAFFGKVRASHDLGSFETNTLHVADRIRVSGRRFLVTKASLDLKSRQQPLTVLEM